MCAARFLSARGQNCDIMSARVGRWVFRRHIESEGIMAKYRTLTSRDIGEIQRMMMRKSRETEPPDDDFVFVADDDLTEEVWCDDYRIVIEFAAGAKTARNWQRIVDDVVSSAEFDIKYHGKPIIDRRGRGASGG